MQENKDQSDQRTLLLETLSQEPPLGTSSRFYVRTKTEQVNQKGEVERAYKLVPIKEGTLVWSVLPGFLCAVSEETGEVLQFSFQELVHNK